MYNDDTLRNTYLWDLEFTGDPEHNRGIKVKKIEPWKKLESHIPAGGSPVVIDLNDETRDVWVWSDIHFGHKNIMRYSGRPYPSTELMNACMIGIYLQVVRPQDIVIFGGDISFMNDEDTNNILNQLHGYKIQIIGNHDLTRDGKARNFAFDERHLCRVVQYQGIDLLFTHYPLTSVPDGCINVHGHIHQHPAPTVRHLNICVEHTNYGPRKLKDLLASWL